MKPRARDALLTLARELAGPKAVKELTLAIDDPAKFLATTKHELFDDPDDWDDPDDLAWCALIEAVGAARRLAEVDWKECASDVLANVEILAGKTGKAALAPARAMADIDDTLTTQHALECFAALLAEVGLAIVSLEKNSDSYAFVVVPAPAVARIAALAKQAAQKVVAWKGRLDRGPQGKLARIADDQLRRAASGSPAEGAA